MGAGRVTDDNIEGDVIFARDGLRIDAIRCRETMPQVTYATLLQQGTSRDGLGPGVIRRKETTLHVPVATLLMQKPSRDGLGAGVAR